MAARNPYKARYNAPQRPWYLIPSRARPNRSHVNTRPQQFRSGLLQGYETMEIDDNLYPYYATYSTLMDAEDDEKRYFVKHSKFGWKGQWQFLTIVGQGTYGIASLWRRVDRRRAREGAEYVVIKDELPDEYNEDYPGGIPEAAADKEWSYDPTLREDWEISLEAQLLAQTNRLNSSHIVKLYHYTRITRMWIHRLYLEWAPAGDLGDLMREIRNPILYKKKICIIPEAFVWTVFHDLAKAVEAMHKGTGLRKKLDWNTVVSRDIKPSNVLLGERHPDPRSTGEGALLGYPKAMLSDFGMGAVIPPDETIPESHRHRGNGAVAFRAPELSQVWNQMNVAIDHRMSVWGLGMTILGCIWFGMPRIPQVKRLPGVKTDYERKMRVMCTYYSKTLLDLIERCLAVHPANRITDEELLVLTRFYRGEFDAGRGEDYLPRLLPELCPRDVNDKIFEIIVGALEANNRTTSMPREFSPLRSADDKGSSLDVGIGSSRLRDFGSSHSKSPKSETKRKRKHSEAFPSYDRIIDSSSSSTPSTPRSSLGDIREAGVDRVQRTVFDISPTPQEPPPLSDQGRYFFCTLRHFPYKQADKLDYAKILEQPPERSTREMLYERLRTGEGIYE